MLAIIRDSVPFVGDTIACISDSLAPRELVFAAPEILLMVETLAGATTDVTCSFDSTAISHDCAVDS